MTCRPTKQNKLNKHKNKKTKLKPKKKPKGYNSTQANR